jgi:hypothetical protein
MSNRIILLMLAVTFGLIAIVWVLNGLWPRSFGGGAISHSPSHAEQVADRKRVREEHDAKEAARRANEKYSPEVLKAAAHSGVPKRLTAEEFDPKTGKVRWPGILLRAEFDTLREKLDRLLAQHAAEPDDAEYQKKADAAAEELVLALKENIRTLDANDYITAHRLLESLVYSLRP